MAGFARLSLTAVDCPEPLQLAQFYRAITGWELDVDDADSVDLSEAHWVQLRSDTGATLAFQRSTDHQPPDWPGPGIPKQLHLDFDVDDLNAAEPQVIAAGAVKAADQPYPDDFRVFLDPAGHPFCLVKAG